jgi:hypothetical protein
MAYLPPPSFEIARPPLEPPLHGLLDAAYVPDLSSLSDDERDKWMGGITVPGSPSTCSDHVHPWLPWTDDPADKADPDGYVADSVFHSVVLTYSTECHALPAQLDNRIKLAKEALIAGTGQAIESIFWGPNDTGTLADFYGEGGNFSLSGSTPLVTGYTDEDCTGILNRNPVSGSITPLSPKQALLALTQALGNCGLGARGFIHAPVYLTEDWAGQSLIKLSDLSDNASNLVTNVRGDYVIGGSGYPGTGPNGHPLEEPADGYVWAYATGPVGVLLSEPEEKETTMVDHTTNLHRIIVERNVAIAANPACLYAVYVDVS